ncbi:hypothetical protein [Butyrivibrio sp.]|uniref:hypothetical protein n=1 Tax=Butyrivibrio sp. TaxID=28121 RepID=UPI0025B96EFD|nr:hypothetical protein [Butyrivibrio sp.]MBQ9302920.1 hypothetical protein [Butyrivibrio sp.]
MMKRIIGTMTAIASAIIMLATVQVTAMAAPQAKDAQPPAQGAAPAQGEAPKGGQAPKDGEQPPEMPDASGAASTGEAPEKPEGEAPKEEPKDGEKPLADADMTTLLENLLESIEALDDEDVKENITELYDAFVDALDAEQAAIDAESDEDTLAEVKQAVEDARAALQSALEEAGIDFDLEPKTGDEAPKAIENGEELSEEIAPKDAEPAVNEDGSADESVEKTSPIKKIGNAIKSFFNKLFKKSE